MLPFYHFSVVVAVALLCLQAASYALASSSLDPVKPGTSLNLGRWSAGVNANCFSSLKDGSTGKILLRWQQLQCAIAGEYVTILIPKTAPACADCELNVVLSFAVGNKQQTYWKSKNINVVPSV